MDMSSSSFGPPPSSVPYDALLIVSFGGPEGPDDVLPFLENVTRGRNIPRERLLEVAEHYQHFGGVSPLNGAIRSLLGKLVQELNTHGPHLPVYWGNRNWHPMLRDVVEQMADDGIQHALAFVTSAFGSYSSCRQYQEDIVRARETVGERAPEIDIIRRFYNHPGFVEAVASRTAEALAELTEDRRGTANLLFTAHSIPVAMASTGPYEAQLRESCRLVAETLGRSQWQLAFQSRSGPPSQPWLEPDVESTLRAIATGGGSRDVIVVPIGFLHDHMEVVFDLDVEVSEFCEELGLTMMRASTPGLHPRFVTMIRELILERTCPGTERPALGSDGPSSHECRPACCQYSPR
jgi:ferrochelatase